MRRGLHLPLTPGDPCRTLVLSDLHLADPEDDRAAAAALAAFLDERTERPPAPGLRWRLVVAGDLFDLEVRRGRAGRRWNGAPAAVIEGLLADFPGVWRALRAFAAAGNRVVILPGNHDAALALPLAAARVRREIGPGSQVLPHWHDPAHGLIVTHGHQLDPDNRFPVWPPRPEAEDDVPLGVLLTRWFVGPLRFRPTTHVEGTPLANLLSVIRSYGPRAPAIVFGYLLTAARIVATQAGGGRRRPGLDGDGTGPGSGEDGRARTEPHRATEPGRGDESAGEALEALYPPPVLASRWETFHRLYLGRVVLTLSAALAVALTLAGAPAGWTPWAVLGEILAPAALFALRGNRYAHRVSVSLEGAARALVERGFCRTFVCGHLHHRADVALEGGRYLNAGMFFRAGRGGAATLSWVEEDGEGLRLRTLPARAPGELPSEPAAALPG